MKLKVKFLNAIIKGRDILDLYLAKLVASDFDNLPRYGLYYGLGDRLFLIEESANGKGVLYEVIAIDGTPAAMVSLSQKQRMELLQVFAYKCILQWHDNLDPDLSFTLLDLVHYYDLTLIDDSDKLDFV